MMSKDVADQQRRLAGGDAKRSLDSEDISLLSGNFDQKYVFDHSIDWRYIQQLYTRLKSHLDITLCDCECEYLQTDSTRVGDTPDVDATFVHQTQMVPWVGMSKTYLRTAAEVPVTTEYDTNYVNRTNEDVDKMYRTPDVYTKRRWSDTSIYAVSPSEWSGNSNIQPFNTSVHSLEVCTGSSVHGDLSFNETSMRGLSYRDSTVTDLVVSPEDSISTAGDIAANSKPMVSSHARYGPGDFIQDKDVNMVTPSPMECLDSYRSLQSCTSSMQVDGTEYTGYKSSCGISEVCEYRGDERAHTYGVFSGNNGYTYDEAVAFLDSDDDMVSMSSFSDHSSFHSMSRHEALDNIILVQNTTTIDSSDSLNRDMANCAQHMESCVEPLQIYTKSDELSVKSADDEAKVMTHPSLHNIDQNDDIWSVCCPFEGGSLSTAEVPAPKSDPHYRIVYRAPPRTWLDYVQSWVPKILPEFIQKRVTGSTNGQSPTKGELSTQSPTKIRTKNFDVTYVSRRDLKKFVREKTWRNPHTTLAKKMSCGLLKTTYSNASGIRISEKTTANTSVQTEYPLPVTPKQQVQECRRCGASKLHSRLSLYHPYGLFRDLHELLDNIVMIESVFYDVVSKLRLEREEKSMMEWILEKFVSKTKRDRLRHIWWKMKFGKWH